MPFPIPDSVGAVRHFNRFYTRQIGVLQEHLLRSQFSLTEVRVLYELAYQKNVTAGELCRELDLDRGYISRMLKDFEAQRLITSTTSPSDRRRAFLSLTNKGRKVFAPLDRRSSAEISAMLAPHSAPKQKALLGAMRQIESILTPASQRAPYSLRPHKPGDMGWIVHRHGELYAQEYQYDERFEALVAEVTAKFIQNFDPKRERCWIAERDAEILGSIFIVQESKSVAKLRLLFVEPGARGLGIGRNLVTECVGFARQAGYKKIVLWTQSELSAARHLYEEAGFKLIKKEPHQSWGRKDLVAETWELQLRA
ncbi:MAG TPA: helix-turn-helix domain-containing GNAT family N-acetyltransferase [Terriglobales bacterium]|nr:helix-turn-helix domain-containing GNAT family N-acetyltransferase [Terriglobales bacterium]